MSEKQVHPHPGTGKVWLPGIEALRGVAALTVVAHHSWALSTMPRFHGSWVVEGLGDWGVNLFFMLSGYLLADTFWREKPADLRVYGLRRFFRIAPAYYANLAILFLFFAGSQNVFSEQGKKQILASLTFTHFLFPGTSSSLNVNGALWTLTIEMMLYAFLPIMALAVRRAPVPALLTLVAIGVGWRFWIAVDGDMLRHFWFGNMKIDVGIQSLFIARQFIGSLPIFAIGIGARWAVTHGYLDGLYRRLPARLGVGTILLLCIPSLLMLHWVEPASSFHNVFLFSAFYPFVMLALLPCLLLAARPQPMTPSPLTRVATWLGERSYSIYLWHFPIVLAVYERGPQLFPPAAGGYWWRLPAILVITLVFASVSYSRIELPGMELGRRLSDRLVRRSTPVRESVVS